MLASIRHPRMLAVQGWAAIVCSIMLMAVAADEPVLTEWQQELISKWHPQAGKDRYDHVEVGFAFQAAKRPDDALRAFEAATIHEPGRPAGWINAATARWEVGRLGAAADMLLDFAEKARTVGTKELAGMTNRYRPALAALTARVAQDYDDLDGDSNGEVAAALFAEAILAEGFQGQPLGTVLVSEQLVAAGLSLFFHPTSAYVLGTTAEVRRLSLDLMRCAVVRRRGFVFASSQSEPACWKGEIFDDDTGKEESLSDALLDTEEEEVDEGDDDDDDDEDDLEKEISTAGGEGANQAVEVGLSGDGSTMTQEGDGRGAEASGLRVGGVAELAIGYLLEDDADMGPMKPGDAGVVDEYDASDDMYAVTFAGVQWWYNAKALQAAGGAAGEAAAEAYKVKQAQLAAEARDEKEAVREEKRLKREQARKRRVLRARKADQKREELRRAGKAAVSALLLKQGTGEGWPELEGLEGALGARDGSLRRHKLQHDKAQLEWLAKRFAGSGAGETFTVGVQAHEATLHHSSAKQQHSTGGVGDALGLGPLLTAEDLQPMADWYGRLVHVRTGEPFPAGSGDVVRGADSNALKAANHQWASAAAAQAAAAAASKSPPSPPPPPAVLVVDDVLSLDALAAVRAQLLESTFWFDGSQDGDFVGASLNEGLSSEVLLRIAEELRHKLPAALREHRLVNLWAYSYGNQQDEDGNSHLHGGIDGGGGLGLHADFAEVHVNLWLTPDEANRHPNEGGGLEVFHRKPPPGSKFEDFNCKESTAHVTTVEGGDSPAAAPAAADTTGSNDVHGCVAKLATFVEQGSSTVIPYRFNRMVLFDASLVHRTQPPVHFKPGFENRRLSLTYLFGNGAVWNSEALPEIKEAEESPSAKQARLQAEAAAKAKEEYDKMWVRRKDGSMALRSLQKQKKKKKKKGKDLPPEPPKKVRPRDRR